MNLPEPNRGRKRRRESQHTHGCGNTNCRVHLVTAFIRSCSQYSTKQENISRKIYRFLDVTSAATTGKSNEKTSWGKAVICFSLKHYFLYLFPPIFSPKPKMRANVMPQKQQSSHFLGTVVCVSYVDGRLMHSRRSHQNGATGRWQNHKRWVVVGSFHVFGGVPLKGIMGLLGSPCSFFFFLAVRWAVLLCHTLLS